MKLTLLTLTIVLLFAVSAIAADKVVVVPLGGKKPTGDAIAADVLEGKTFSNKDDTNIVGTLPTQTFDPASTNVPAGYYNATTLNGVDSDLATGNIRSGATIFGVPGKTEVVDTTSGDVVAGEILSGKKAWVDGSEVTGTIPTQTLSPANDTVAAGNYAATTLSTVDIDLAASNIRLAKNVFGLTGTVGIAWGCTPGSTVWDETTCTTNCTASVGGAFQTGCPTLCQNITVAFATGFTPSSLGSALKGLFCNGE